MSALSRIKQHIDAQRIAEAKAKQRCVVVVASTRRTRGITEPNTHAYRAADVMTCFHDVSYTMPCKRCNRSVSESKEYLRKLKLKLSIT